MQRVRTVFKFPGATTTAADGASFPFGSTSTLATQWLLVTCSPHIMLLAMVVFVQYALIWLCTASRQVGSHGVVFCFSLLWLTCVRGSCCGLAVALFTPLGLLVSWSSFGSLVLLGSQLAAPRAFIAAAFGSLLCGLTTWAGSRERSKNQNIIVGLPA